jgi:hypothetical protein
MVTSQEIYENIMGYRGSKSSTRVLVKEQRVDGSCNRRFKDLLLRCTLMTHESGNPIEILSNLFLSILSNIFYTPVNCNIKHYSSNSIKFLDP